MLAETILRRGETGHRGLSSGFNLAIEHDPDTVVAATTPADVAAAVRFASRGGLAVAVMNTGHGPSVPSHGGVLIRMGGLSGVEVDAARRTARIEGGATWRDVIEAAAPYGLAPLNGSSPQVGVTGYTLGGGVGLLARRFGFAADHVRWMDVVTADGRLRHVAADSDWDADLFWALRGAGANFGVTTAMEIDLFSVPALYGGELCFDAGACQQVLHTYAAWVRGVPETMASSVMLMRYPDDSTLPAGLRGRHVTHVRVAYSGAQLAEGEKWVEPLRRMDGCLLYTLRLMPYQEVGTIHHEPTDAPAPAFDRNILLRDFDGGAATVLSEHAGPLADAPYLVELRAWGGALSRPPAVGNAVGARDARFSLLGISDAEPTHRARRDALLDAMRPWGTGMTYLNFAGVEDTALHAVRRAYRAADFVRLQHLKSIYDPHNIFRVNFNVPPTGWAPECAPRRLSAVDTGPAHKRSAEPIVGARQARG